MVKDELTEKENAIIELKLQVDRLTHINQELIAKVVQDKNYHPP